MEVYPGPYVSYLIEFHATRDFFECHELLEEYWKEHPDDGNAELWTGLIQLAVGLYHERRGNRRGAEKMYSKAQRKLKQSDLESLGIHKQHALEQIIIRRSAVAYGSEYKDINLKIDDAELMLICGKECAKRGLRWGSPSPLHDDMIVHRHLLRDRTEVVQARKDAWARKRRG